MKNKGITSNSLPMPAFCQRTDFQRTKAGTGRYLFPLCAIAKPYTT